MSEDKFGVLGVCQREHAQDELGKFLDQVSVFQFENVWKLSWKYSVGDLCIEKASKVKIVHGKKVKNTQNGHLESRIFMVISGKFYEHEKKRTQNGVRYASSKGRNMKE